MTLYWRTVWQNTFLPLEKRSSLRPSRTNLKGHLLRLFSSKVYGPSYFLTAISLYGKARYTTGQYEHLVVMKHNISDQPAMLCSTTVHKIVFLSLLEANFVKSGVISFPIKYRYLTHITKSLNLSQRQSEAVAVLLSSWAKLDVECLSVVRELVCLSNGRCVRPLRLSDLRVDSAAQVTWRAKQSKNSDVLWVKERSFCTGITRKEGKVAHNRLR